MLNKKICKKCWRRHMIKKWSVREDRFWEDRIICCPDIGGTSVCSLLSIIDDPPQWCKYELEHTVTEEDSKKEPEEVIRGFGVERNEKSEYTC